MHPCTSAGVSAHHLRPERIKPVFEACTIGTSSTVLRERSTTRSGLARNAKVKVSDILGRAVNGNVEIVHERHGSGEGEPLLLIMGFSVQRHFWPDELCDELARQGFDVVTFDNRDC